jgi:hypothetical protein
MGVFIAQALTVLLGTALVMLSLALLAFVTAQSRRKQQLRPARIVLSPARGSNDTDCPIGTQIDRGEAAPSRAPPTIASRARQERPTDTGGEDSADAPPG